MEKSVFLLVRCDEQTEQKQKYESCVIVESAIKKIKGIEKTYFTGRPEADITAFAKWDESEIATRTKQIREITGVKEVVPKILITV